MSLVSQHSNSDLETSSDWRLSRFAYRGSPWRLAQVQTTGAHLREARWPSRQVMLLQYLLSKTRKTGSFHHIFGHVSFLSSLLVTPQGLSCWCCGATEVVWGLWCAGRLDLVFIGWPISTRYNEVYDLNTRNSSSRGSHLINPVQMESWCYIRKQEAAYLFSGC